MNFGIDIDDTISNTFETFLPYMKKFVEEDLKRKLDLNLESKVDYYNVIEKYNLSEDEARKFWVDYFVKIIENVIPKKSSVEIINKIKENGNKVFLITARFDDGIIDVRAVTEKWLEANNIKYDKLIIDSQNKLEIAKQENIDIFLDDSIRNCEMLSSGNIKTYMFSTENNKYYENENISKVSSWDEFYENIKEVI
ncbi:MAG: hypothetical protein IJW20_07725 [Clostridia bacterium]|nr:hypothetical protein [Clostridia bacterium]